MHGVAHPRHVRELVADPGEELRQDVVDLPGTHAGDERQSAGFGVRIELLREREGILGGRGRAQLDADGILHLREEVDVRAVDLTGALTDPQEVPGHVVGQTRTRIDAGERAFVLEEQRLVGGVELRGPQSLEVRAARVHEADRPIDLAGGLLVALVAGVRGEETAVPFVDQPQVGEAPWVKARMRLSVDAETW